MKATIQKSGNSLGIRIPSHIAKDLFLENGSTVEIIEEDQRVVIQPQTRKKLQDLLELITEDNIHTEQFDIPARKEML